MQPFLESTLGELYQSAVDAFPLTTRRQHATDPIQIEHLQVVPFLGVRTLFLKTRAVNEGREYGPLILFKKVQYHDGPGVGILSLRGSDGKDYHFERPTMEWNDALLRCNCKDFYWRFNYYDHLDQSLYGRKRAEYEAKQNPGAANPMHMPGMCKHLMKMMQVLENSGLISA